MRAMSVILCILAACSSGGSMTTMDSFYEIPIGSTSNEVVESIGKPYALHRREDGAGEYEHIERIKAGGRNLDEGHSFLLIKDGNVASKRVDQSSPSPYVFDSYEMQTTQSF